MWKYARGCLVTVGLIVGVFALASAAPALATTTKSPNYEASEAEFGAGAALETCSGQYCAKATIGSIGGESSSQNFTAAFSEVGDSEEPLLEVLVEPGESNLGKLDIDRTATRTMLLHIKSHFAGGYTVQVIGSPPSFEGYTLAAPVAPEASAIGKEQFALNVVANTSPEVGADPVLVPSEDVVTGVISSKYNVPNLFAYTDGDIVAQTESESSQIRYTISMIVNVSGDTPAGHYSGDFSAVVTPVF